MDQTAAIILVEEAVRAVYDLENHGLPFNRTPRRGESTRDASEGTRGISVRRRSAVTAMQQTEPAT